jgi:hypothetical protein
MITSLLAQYEYKKLQSEKRLIWLEKQKEYHEMMVKNYEEEIKYEIFFIKEFDKLINEIN